MDMNRKRNYLLENLDRKVNKNLSIRRYNLSDMISESYKALYSCEEDTNLQKIVESHLDDVRNNPTDIDRLSKQLCTIKELIRMTESGKLNDEDLVPKKSYDTVAPKKERALGLEESYTEDESVSLDEKDLTEDAEETNRYYWGDWQHERGSSCRVKFYSSGIDLTNQIIGVVYEETPEQPYYGAEIYDDSTASTIEDRADDSYHFDTEKEAMEWVEEWFSSNEIDKSKELDESEDAELTDEEVDELTKHLEEIRKNKKMKECDAPKKSVEESTKPRKLKRANEAAPVWSRYHIVNPDGETIDSYTDRKDAEDWVNQLYKDGDYKRGDLKVVDSQAKNESKSYESLNLSEFSKKSSSKAFMKTFKKMQDKLKEGTALTRQESIALYKAANSAMTQLSVELEHNPDFLDTFKESVSLLSVDVNKLLGSLKEGKAPSKKTMKSLAKFTESLLCESGERTYYVNYLETEGKFKGKHVDLPIRASSEEEAEKIFKEKHPEIKKYDYKVISGIDEAEGEETPVEDEDDEFVGDEEGDISSEEAEEFDQEYADARVELHKELADEHADSEDPEVQEKLAQDEAEVTSLPGITDEQLAEITGEIPEDPEDKDDVEESKDLDSGDNEITDDELAELKKHLKEMRKIKRGK